MAPESGCRIIALCGLPGSGKSTVAEALLKELPLREVNRDRIRQAQFPLCAFSDDEKAAATAAVKSALTANCLLEFSSLVDGMTLATANQRHDLARHCYGLGGRFLVLYLDCPLEVACSRVAADRDHLAGDRNAELVAEVADRFEPPGDEALRLDATLPVEQLRALSLHAVRGLLAPVVI